MDKKASVSIIDIFLGIFIIAGGISIIFSYVNLGLFLAAFGTVLEAFKILIVHGLK